MKAKIWFQLLHNATLKFNQELWICKKKQCIKKKQAKNVKQRFVLAKAKINSRIRNSTSWAAEDWMALSSVELTSFIYNWTRSSVPIVQTYFMLILNTKKWRKFNLNILGTQVLCENFTYLAKKSVSKLRLTLLSTFKFSSFLGNLWMDFTQIFVLFPRNIS